MQGLGSCARGELDAEQVQPSQVLNIPPATMRVATNKDDDTRNKMVVMMIALAGAVQVRHLLDVSRV